jgi:hypothetical protein
MKLDLLNSFLSWKMKKRFHQIELFMKYPGEVQQELLFELLNAAKNTEWGRKYDFASIQSFETFQERVPLHFYEDIEADIERLRKGTQNIMWPTDIRWFAKSSGTTNSKSKFIPVSSEAIEDCHFKGGKDLLSIYCNNKPETEIFSGMSLRLGGATSINNVDNKSFYGDLSAIIIENLPFWVEMRSTPNNKISLMDEWEEKIEAIANTTIKEDVSSLAGVPSWMLVLARRVLEKTGKKNLHEVWPNLELYMHGGVNFSPYKEQFKALLPDPKFSFLETYNASEGFFGIQDIPNSSSMLLMLDYGIFYEFIPMDAFAGTDSKTIPLSEVELDKNYAVVISSNAGLWRYIIGDTVKFTSKTPYRITVSGRTKHFINAFGEELIIENAEEALRHACTVHHCQITEYSAAPVFMDGNGEQGAHEWMIEFEQLPNDLVAFMETMDNKLKSVNSDYEAKRHKNMALNPPIVHVARKNLFYDWLRNKGKLGGQHKVPRLSNNRLYMDEFLEMNAHLKAI